MRVHKNGKIHYQEYRRGVVVDDLTVIGDTDRHNHFWKEKALKKLPALIASTDMLACGEDLGMVPATVPKVIVTVVVVVIMHPT